jgi:hypothetical protein
MTLSELCEPLFLYACGLGRRVHARRSIASGEVRDSLAALFSEIRARAAMATSLRQQFERIEPALLIFIDEYIRSVGGPLARRWSAAADKASIAAETNKLLAIVDETLADPGEAAAERLGPLYTCLALSLADRPGMEHVREKMLLMALRLNPPSDPDTAAIQAADLTRTFRQTAAPLLVVTLGLVASIAGAIVAASQNDSRRLERAMAEVAAAERAQPVPGASP